MPSRKLCSRNNCSQSGRLWGGKGEPMATMLNQQPQSRPNAVQAALNPPCQALRLIFGPLVVFLLVSIVASVSQQVEFFSLIPQPLRPFLGEPPSAHLVSLALAIYFGSMLVILAHGICSGGQPGSLWFHGACRSTFYLLYFIGGGLPGHLWLVLLVGSILFGLEFLWLRLNQRRASWGLG